jgi:hypothetical protein
MKIIRGYEMRKKILVKSLMLVSGLVFFDGCASSIPSPEVYHDSTKKVEIVIHTIPQLNTVSTVEIGENMYSKYNERTNNTYEVELLEPAVGTYYAGSGFINTNNGIDGHKAGKLRKRFGTNSNTACYGLTCIYDINNNGYFTHVGNALYEDLFSLNNPAKYKLIPTPNSYDKDSFKYVALYQGKSENKIKISFREFKDDMARPAFTQDIEYELEKDGTSIIGFKGLRIEVLKATNTDITYKVVKDYN